MQRPVEPVELVAEKNGVYCYLGIILDTGDVRHFMHCTTLVATSSGTRLITIAIYNMVTENNVKISISVLEY